MQCYTERRQSNNNSKNSLQIEHSLSCCLSLSKKISNHPNSPSSLQKLLGKSSVPCHISHIYQDAAQPITSEGLSNYLLAQWPRRDTLQAADSCLRRNKAIFRDAAAQAKANYGEHNAGFSRALTEWMARS